MNRRTTIVVSATLLVAAVLISWHFSRAANELASELRDARRDTARLRAALVVTSRRAAVPAPVKAQPTQPSARTRPIETALPSEEQIRAQAKQRAEARNSALLTSPSLQVMFEESRRGWYREEFAALFRKQNLTPQQEDTVINALVAWEVKTKDLAAIQKQQNLAANDSTLKAQRDEAQAAMIRDAQAVLGPDALTITKAYTRLDQARSYVAGYGGLFSRLGQPLSFSQFEALTDAFGEVSPEAPPEPDRLSTVQWNQIAAHAQQILTPAQWAVFDSTTAPSQSGGRWNSAATDALANVTPPATPPHL